MLQLLHLTLWAVNMGSQAHVVLKMVKVVTYQLGNDLILFHHLLLQFCHLRPWRAELLLKGLNLTKLFGLHDHHIVRVMHRIIRLEKEGQSVDTNNGSTVQPIVTGGEGAWKPTKTSGVHCRLWLKVPTTYLPITDWVHSKCSQIMCSTWNLWEHLCNI